MSPATGHTDPTSSIRARRSVQPTGRGFDVSSARMASISCSLIYRLRFGTGACGAGPSPDPGEPRSARLMPLGQLHGDSLGSGEEHELAQMEVHDLVAGANAVRPQPGHLRLDVVDGEANVVEPEPVQPPDDRILDRVGVVILQ